MSPCIKYEEWSPSVESELVIGQANLIIQEYQADGYDLTLRQLYYQFVSRDLIPNNQKAYDRLGSIISRGRRAGLIDWDAIIDRTRNLQRDATWESPAEIIAAVARQFSYDLWDSQPYYVECWFEKDALMGVFERIASELRVPFFSCRGYTSDSEVWAAAQRLYDKSVLEEKTAVVLHFGDHDPSGLDMSRDIFDRLYLFGADVDVRRIALNMDQVRRYKPPPNPAKVTDSRFAAYQAEYGDESWELDALDPKTLTALVRVQIERVLDAKQWKKDEAREQQARDELASVSKNYERVIKSLKGKR